MCLKSVSKKAPLYYYETRWEKPKSKCRNPQEAERSMAWNLAPASWSAAVLCRFGWGKPRRISNPVKKKAAEDNRTPRRWRAFGCACRFPTPLNPHGPNTDSWYGTCWQLRRITDFLK